MFNILEEIKGARTIGISGHKRPDGDCVGACMALYLFLRKALPEVIVEVYLDKPAAIFDCIQGIENIKTSIASVEPMDVFIALDCSKDRLGEAVELFDRAKKTINIDHHISNANGTGMVNYIVTDASSTCELIFDVIDEELLDMEIAKAIYIGIIHDTGVFQYSNTSKKTMEIAGKLISFGFPFSSIIDETFYEKTYVQNQVLGRAILESIRFMDGKCIVSVVDKKMMEFYHVGPEDLNGIVNQLRIIKGIECAVFMYETGLQEYKVSMRSNNIVNVSEIATFFGGGGHIRAAGCTMNGTFHDVINNLSQYIEKQLS
ncbi:MAG TPA: bifunctional oligoribonuclease/PAP phosphatase NrnA [Lachnospiraceae bacterium]|nr:bifunctional oligoribonuclease/PAP phosphatase NrnA [Lachnospiraceae bacterium]